MRLNRETPTAYVRQSLDALIQFQEGRRPGNTEILFQDLIRELDYLDRDVKELIEKAKQQERPEALSPAEV